MRKKRSNSLGEYLSNIFIIKCNTYIDFNNISACDSYEQLGTFIHEYIHFFQNASMTYGNMNIEYYFALTLSRLHAISESSNSKVSRIVRPPQCVDEAEIIYELTSGDTDQWTYDTASKIEIVSSSVYLDPCYDKKYECYSTPSLILQVYGGNSFEEKEFRFGAQAISESMAALYERKMYSIESSTKQVQYDICTILWNKYVSPQYYNRTDLIFAMCECSLMFVNPGYIFYIILTEVVANETGIITVDTIYHYYDIQPRFWEDYIDYYNRVIEQFNNLFPSDNQYMNGLNQYVTGFLDKLFKKRKANFHWLTDLYQLEPNEMKVEFINVIKQTQAVPLIVNNKLEIYSGLVQEENKMNMIYFYSIYAFNNLFGINGEDQCSLYPICSRNDYSEIDINCKKSPWLKCNNSSLCLMGVIWHMWSLSGKELV